jgi:hypothetical protein
LYLENGKYAAKATKAASIKDKSVMIQPCFLVRMPKSDLQVRKQAFIEVPFRLESLLQIIGPIAAYSQRGCSLNYSQKGVNPS